MDVLSDFNHSLETNLSIRNGLNHADGYHIDKGFPKVKHRNCWFFLGGKSSPIRSAITSAQIVIPVGQSWMHTEANMKVITINNNHQYSMLDRLDERPYRKCKSSSTPELRNHVTESASQPDNNRLNTFNAIMITYPADNETSIEHEYQAVPASNVRNAVG